MAMDLPVEGNEGPLAEAAVLLALGETLYKDFLRTCQRERKVVFKRPEEVAMSSTVMAQRFRSSSGGPMLQITQYA